MNFEGAAETLEIATKSNKMSIVVKDEIDETMLK